MTFYILHLAVTLAALTVACPLSDLLAATQEYLTDLCARLSSGKELNVNTLKNVLCSLKVLTCDVYTVRARSRR